MPVLKVHLEKLCDIQERDCRRINELLGKNDALSELNIDVLEAVHAKTSQLLDDLPELQLTPEDIKKRLDNILIAAKRLWGLKPDISLKVPSIEVTPYSSFSSRCTELYLETRKLLGLEAQTTGGSGTPTLFGYQNVLVIPDRWILPEPEVESNGKAVIPKPRTWNSAALTFYLGLNAQYFLQDTARDEQGANNFKTKTLSKRQQHELRRFQYVLALYAVEKKADVAQDQILSALIQNEKNITIWNEPEMLDRYRVLRAVLESMNASAAGITMQDIAILDDVRLILPKKNLFRAVLFDKHPDYEYKRLLTEKLCTTYAPKGHRRLVHLLESAEPQKQCKYE